MGNSDGGTALENITGWGWEAGFYTTVLISHWLWVPWKKVWSWVEAGSCTWGNSLRGLAAEGCLLAALPIARGIILLVLKGDQSNASLHPPQVCSLWSHAQYCFYHLICLEWVIIKCPRNAPTWWRLTLPVNFIGHLGISYRPETLTRRTKWCLGSWNLESGWCFSVSRTRNHSSQWEKMTR